MLLHVALPSEDLVVAADTGVLILMIHMYSKHMVKRIWVLDTRITNVLILKQFRRILVNYIPWHY